MSFILFLHLSHRSTTRRRKTLSRIMSRFSAFWFLRLILQFYHCIAYLPRLASPSSINWREIEVSDKMLRLILSILSSSLKSGIAACHSNHCIQRKVFLLPFILIWKVIIEKFVNWFSLFLSDWRERWENVWKVSLHSSISKSCFTVLIIKIELLPIFVHSIQHCKCDNMFKKSGNKSKDFGLKT